MLLQEKALSDFSKILTSKDQRFQKLISYADKHLKYRNIKGRAYTAEDIVNEVMTKIAYGERSWDPAVEPDLFSFLFMVIRSFIENIAKEEKRSVKAVNNPAKQERTDDKFIIYLEKHSSIKSPDPSKVYQNKLTAECCLDKFPTDAECALVVMDLYAGMQRREIAQDLGLELRKVEAIIKRVKRRLKNIIIDYNGSNRYEKEKFTSP